MTKKRLKKQSGTAWSLHTAVQSSIRSLSWNRHCPAVWRRRNNTSGTLTPNCQVTFPPSSHCTYTWSGQRDPTVQTVSSSPGWVSLQGSAPPCMRPVTPVLSSPGPVLFDLTCRPLCLCRALPPLSLSIYLFTGASHSVQLVIATR